MTFVRTHFEQLRDDRAKTLWLFTLSFRPFCYCDFIAILLAHFRSGSFNFGGIHCTKFEPFLSHAERGKTFWIREFWAGMRLYRVCGATPFLAGIRILNFGGGGEIRTLETLSSLPPFQGGALDHYATPPD